MCVMDRLLTFPLRIISRAFSQLKRSPERPGNSNNITSLTLDFEESDESVSLSTEERLKIAMDLLITLLKLFTASQALVIVLDDCVYLDPHAWTVTQKIAEEVPGCMLVLATPPMTNVYLKIFHHK